MAELGAEDGKTGDLPNASHHLAAVNWRGKQESFGGGSGE
jgi:hypothetical protein